MDIENLMSSKDMLDTSIKIHNNVLQIETIIFNLKFMFSKKATKIDKIFTVDLTFTK